MSIAALLALALPTSAHAAEPYEGAWVTSPKHCSDKADGPNSLTVIDLKVDLNGKPMPMVEQYEHHCVIDSKSTSASDTTLKATCYEFWDDYKKKVNGTKETIKLSVVSKDQLKINGKQYRRCPEKAAKSTKR
ncbi:hypothetical protein JQ628_13625 [Bradyrhizobium lablabi]|uniref:hypothetical protein n=1 Tax=Bradyrhizobium lablabi TaxID=722472 RepID=UPI001BA9A5B2|nr:hypothetical protein [Bradyrhizobium lablabi]MBR1122561.1 hypothetical protein [Bradyrhizobium lablabi]